MTTYLFHTTLLISGFTIFYWLILRHETYFRLNRWVILGGVLFCLSLPFIEIPASLSLWSNTDAPTSSIIEKITQAPAQLISTPTSSVDETYYPQNDQGAAITHSESTFSWMKILSTLYVIGLVIFFLVFILQIVVLLTQRYNLNSFQTGKYTIVEQVKDVEPCSFLNYIFINPNKYDEETYEHIIEHEKAHIDQSHFVDKVIAELLVVIFWFNPFTWLLRTSISQNLEFLTDKSLLDKGIQKDKYQMSLLKVSVSNKPLNLTASYNSSFLKSRISMMNTKNSSVVSTWKYLFIVPLFVLSVASLNAVQNNGSQKNTISSLEYKDHVAEPPVRSEKVYAPTNNNTNTPNNSNSTNHISREVQLEHISKIALGMSGNLILSYGKEQKIVITGPENLVNQMSTNVAAGNWQVSYKEPGVRKMSNQINVYAQLTDLTHLALSGSGTITTTNTFQNLGEVFIALSGTGNIEFAGNASFINTALSGAGNIAVKTNADKLNTALSGSGNISFSGKSPDTRYVNSGSGNISAIDLESRVATVVIDGASSIAVNATDLLDVTGAGSAVIRYSGNPKIIKDLENEARIVQVD